MKDQSAEYLNGLLKIGKWNYQVSINVDYKISYSYLDRIINKVLNILYILVIVYMYMYRCILYKYINILVLVIAAHTMCQCQNATNHGGEKAQKCVCIDKQ